MKDRGADEARTLEAVGEAPGLWPLGVLCGAAVVCIVGAVLLLL